MPKVKGKKFPYTAAGKKAAKKAAKKKKKLIPSNLKKTMGGRY